MELPEALAAHLVEPRCVGDLEPRDAEGHGANPACGDVLQVHARREGDGLRLRFRAQACGGVLAVASFALERLDGRPAEALAELDLEREVDALGGLPPHRRHAIRVVGRALDEIRAQLGV